MMRSTVTLTIDIEHADNLGSDAYEIAGDIARFLAGHLDLSAGRLYVRDGRNAICGPITVRLVSAAIEGREDRIRP